MDKRWHLSNEQELVQACIKGNRDAQRELFERFSGKMFGVCARYCQNREEARDAMQEGFIKIFTILEKFSFNSKLETWITRIMINTAIDHFKKSLRFELYESGEQLYASHPTSEDTYIPEEDASQLSQKELLNLICQLPHGYRVVFNLYAIEGKKHREIAEMLNISEGTSKSQLARARKMLQKMIIERKILD